MDFNFKVQQVLQNDGKQAYYQWGPLVFALKFDEKKKILEELAATSGASSGFYEYSISPVDTTGWSYLAKKGEKFQLHFTDNELSEYPWNSPAVYLKGNLYTAKKEPVEVKLVPLGSTILRRTTFPLLNN